jgi:hypothetical protein
MNKVREEMIKQFLTKFPMCKYQTDIIMNIKYVTMTAM